MKAAREQWWIIYRRTTIQVIADFFSESMVARKEWNDIFKVLKENCELKILYRWKYPLKRGWNKVILRLMKIIHFWDTSSKRIAKVNFSERREMVSERNLEDQKWRKSNRYGKFYVMCNNKQVKGWQKLCCENSNKKKIGEVTFISK